MKKSPKTAITIGVSILLAIFLIWWAMRGIDFNKTWESLQRANYWWIFASVVLGFIGYRLRSERWRMLLGTLHHPTSSADSFYSVCMNYLWNMLIPRSGEIARCTTLYALNETPVEKSFGTVISERVIDLICLLIIGLLALIFNFNVIGNLWRDIWDQRNQNSQEGSFSLYIALGVFALAFLLFILFGKHLKKLTIYPKIHHFLNGLKEGIQTVFRLKQRRKFLLYTFLIWFCYYLMTYLVVFALPETAHLPPGIGFYLLLVGGIGMVIPASGGIGAFHSAMRLGFIVLGLGEEIGVTFGFLVHTPHTLLAFTVGVYSLIMISLRKRKA